MSILGILTGGLLDRVFKTLDGAIASQTDREKIKGDVTIATVKTVVGALVASGTFQWWHPQNLIGYCVFALVFRVVVWDTVLGLGVTPNPGPFVLWIAMAVIGFYFANLAISTAAGKIAGALAGRR